MSIKNRWIITDHAHPSVRKGLEDMGKLVDWFPDIQHNELMSVIGDYEGLVISSKTEVQKELIDAASNLKIVARLGSGMEHVDIDYCNSKGIDCLSSPEGNANAVAEHAFSMLLALSNNIRIANNEMLSGVWKREENRGFELRHSTVGIIGYGNTGSAFVGKFPGWDVEVFAYDKYKSGFGSESVKEVRYEELIEKSDIISFHIPLNEETRHWINKDFICACKPGVILINTSRGAIADTPSLVWGLDSGLIGGLCIDVFEDEPISKGNLHSGEIYKDLLSFRQVIATPHIAGWTRESKILLVETLILKIAKALKKQGAQ